MGISRLNSDVCPVCEGTGWESFYRDVDGYKTPLFYARKCTVCGAKQKLRDDIGFPQKYPAKFNFDAYSRSMDTLRKIMDDFISNFENRWKTAGKGLYLWSKTPGSGKTYLSCCLARSVMRQHDIRVRFVTVPDYVSAVGDSYKRERGALDATEIYRKCDLLVFDDIGSQKSGEWQEQELFRIVNERMNAWKITIFTSNVPPEKLNLGARTISRILKASIVLQMPEESIRLKEAQQEQQKFLKDLVG